MANAVATPTVLVTQLTGQAWIRGEDGVLLALRPGMRIPADAEIITAEGASVQLQGAGGDALEIAGGRTVQLTEDLLFPPDAQEAAVGQSTPAGVADALTALNEGQDPFAELEPTAATLGGGDGAGSTFVRLLNVVELTSPLDLLYPRSMSGVEIDPQLGGVLPLEDDGETPPVEIDPVSITVNEVGLNNDSDAREIALVQVPGFEISVGGSGQYGAISFVNGAWVYTLTQNFLHELGQDANTAAGADSVLIRILDSEGNEQDVLVTVDIVDDVPVAVSFNAGKLIEDGLESELSGSVSPLANTGNSYGADEGADSNALEWGSISAKLSLNGAPSVDVSLSDYGVIVRNANGLWSFKLDNSKPATQKLNKGDAISVELAYQLTDKDADVAVNYVRFTIEGETDTAKVTPKVGTGPDAGIVYEKGLLSQDDTSESTKGSIDVMASDGIATVNIGGKVFSLAQLKGNVSLLESVDTGEGVLTITSYVAGAGDKEGTINYSYQLKAAQQHAPAEGNNTLGDSVPVTVTGVGSQSATGVVQISIVDDVPVAVSFNAGKLIEDGLESELSGSVSPLANTGNSYGADEGADSNALEWGSISAKLSLNGAPSVDVSLSDYGVIVRNANGLWSFKLDNSKPATQKLNKGDAISVELAYQLTDKDADVAVNYVRFTIEGEKDTAKVTPKVGTGPDAGIVYEKGLLSQDDTSESTKGSIDVMASDGIATVNIGGKVFSLAQLKGNVSLLESVDTGEGVLTITSYVAGAGDKEGTINYSYQLKAAQQHAPAEGNNTLGDSVPVTVTGVGSQSATEVVQITIVDDVSTAVDSYVALNAPIGSIAIRGLESGFQNVQGGTVNDDDNDHDSYIDSLRWGASNNTKKSGYDFVDNTQLINAGTGSLGSGVSKIFFKLGDFSHVNYPIDTGTAIQSAELFIKFDVVLDGDVHTIEHVIKLNHTETTNTGDGNNDASRDIVTIDNSTLTKTFNVEGKAYILRIDGFKTSEGSENAVTEVLTRENMDNKFGLFASVEKVADLQKLEGVLDEGYSPGADGYGVGDKIVWKDGLKNDEGYYVVNNEYGVFKGRSDGSYSFVLHEDAREKMLLDSSPNVYFTYEIKDSDGDFSSARLVIDLSALQKEVRSISGTNNADILQAGVGQDVMLGRAGSDTFAWALASLDGGRDVVKDYTLSTKGEVSAYTFTFNNIGSFSGIDEIVLQLNGNEYNAVSSGGINGGDGFHSAANNLCQELLDAGYDAEYNSSSRTFVVKSSFGDLLDISVSTGSYTVSLNENFGVKPVGDIFDFSEIPENFVKFKELNGVAFIEVSEGSVVIQTISLEGHSLSSLRTDLGMDAKDNDFLSFMKSVGLLKVGEFNENSHIIKADGGTASLIGTDGDDIFLGSSEADSFVWKSENAGSVESPAYDVVLDFGRGGDSLNLSELLHGEEDVTADLTSYLKVNSSGIDTIIQVSSNGALEHGFNQQITLKGVSFADLGLNADASQSDIISQLVSSQKIILD